MRERILVVDDEHDVADSLARLLHTLGYEARAIYNGQDAADVAMNYLPDLAFIDIAMPGFDGYKTVARIRSRAECSHAVLVALTGYANPEHKVKAYEAGFDLHVAKPTSLDTLQSILAIIDPHAVSESTTERIARFVKERDQDKIA